MKKLLLTGFLFCSLIGFAAEEIPVPETLQINGTEYPEEWTEYTTVDGVKIEYKMKQCEGDKMRAQNLLLFKFTNTTDQELTISWATKVSRNGECWNCGQLDSPENMHELVLSSGESIEGDCKKEQDEALYIFGNFIKLVPGMTEQTLTNFELLDLNVR